MTLHQCVKSRGMTADEHSTSRLTAHGLDRGHTAAIIDLDNLLHRGFDHRSRTPKPQGVLDIPGLANELNKAGVRLGTVCRNRDFSKLAEMLWAAHGFRVRSVGLNCDPAVIEEAERYVSECRADAIVLVSGDSDYIDLVNRLHSARVKVAVWARRSTASRPLVDAADQVRWVDDLLTSQRAA